VWTNRRVPWGRAVMTKLIVACRDFANVPPNDNAITPSPTRNPEPPLPLQTVVRTWQVAVPADDTNKSHLHAQRHEEQHTKLPSSPINFVFPPVTLCKNWQRWPLYVRVKLLPIFTEGSLALRDDVTRSRTNFRLEKLPCSSIIY